MMRSLILILLLLATTNVSCADNQNAHREPDEARQVLEEYLKIDAEGGWSARQDRSILSPQQKRWETIYHPHMKEGLFLADSDPFIAIESYQIISTTMNQDGSVDAVVQFSEVAQAAGFGDDVNNNPEHREIRLFDAMHCASVHYKIVHVHDKWLIESPPDPRVLVDAIRAAYENEIKENKLADLGASDAANKYRQYFYNELAKLDKARTLGDSCHR